MTEIEQFKIYFQRHYIFVRLGRKMTFQVQFSDWDFNVNEYFIYNIFSNRRMHI